jgi:hypothetical protein
MISSIIVTLQDTKPDAPFSRRKFRLWKRVRGAGCSMPFISDLLFIDSKNVASTFRVE